METSRKTSFLHESKEDFVNNNEDNDVDNNISMIHLKIEYIFNPLQKICNEYVNLRTRLAVRRNQLQSMQFHYDDLIQLVRSKLIKKKQKQQQQQEQEE